MNGGENTRSTKVDGHTVTYVTHMRLRGLFAVSATLYLKIFHTSMPDFHRQPFVSRCESAQA